MAYLNGQDVLNMLRFNPLANNKFNIPELEPETEFDEKMDFIGFNYAKTSKEHEKVVHFFLEDYMFNRVWNIPEKSAEDLRNFKAVCTPDFSMYRDMPLALQLFNRYRSMWCGAYWQSLGMTVYPTVGWSSEESFEFCFLGVPKHAVVVGTTVGSQRDPVARALFDRGWAKMLEVLEPKAILMYSSTRKDLPGPVYYIGRLNIEMGWLDGK